MQLAFQEALKALDEGEVPIGAIITRDGQVISRGYNRIEHLSDATAHAEIIAIGAASSHSASWRLNGCTLYVTLEPCLMCLGAIMQSRIESVVYGAPDLRFGAIDSHPYRQNIEKSYNWFPKITSNIMAEESSRLLSSFFASLRKKK